MHPEETYYEQDLLKRIELHDEKAFEAIYRHYRDKVYAGVVKLTMEPTLAEEVVQDTFLKVWLKRTTLSTIDNFPGWLFTIAERYTLDAIKRRARKKNNPQLWLADFSHEAVAENDAEQHLQQKELQLLIRQALDQLTPRQREIFQLSKQQGLKREEVAHTLHLSPETVKTHLEIAVKAIRAYLLAKTDRATALVLITLLMAQ